MYLIETNIITFLGTFGSFRDTFLGKLDNNLFASMRYPPTLSTAVSDVMFLYRTLSTTNGDWHCKRINYKCDDCGVERNDTSENVARSFRDHPQGYKLLRGIDKPVLGTHGKLCPKCNSAAVMNCRSKFHEW